MRSQLVTWFTFLSLGVSVALIVGFGILFPGVLPNNVSALIDRGPVTQLILAVFCVSLLLNIKNTLFLVNQFRHVRIGFKQLPGDNQSIRITAGGILGHHGERLLTVYCRSRGKAALNQDVSLGIIRNRLRRKEWFVRCCCTLLITLGMIGTVLGLTQSLGGLSTTVNAVAHEAISKPDDEDDKSLEETNADGTHVSATKNELAVSAGLNQALGGMASAFITTLLGAVFGGIFLKIVAQSTANLTEQLMDNIELSTEENLLAFLARNTSNQDPNSLQEIVRTISSLSQSVRKQGKTIDKLASVIKEGFTSFNVAPVKTSAARDIQSNGKAVDPTKAESLRPR